MKAIYCVVGFIHYLFDMLIPRFVTEELALIYDEEDDTYDVYAALWLCDEEDVFDAIVTCRCFNFFGFGLFPTYDNLIEI